MTFGLLSLGQMALGAVLVGGAVLTLFFLKVRHPLVEVPSLVLWRQVLDEHRRDSFIERLRRLISLLAALAIALALTFAAGEPRPTGPGGGRVAIVIDNSAAMLAAMPDGDTRLDRARALARSLATSLGGEARFQVADTSGRLLTPAGLDRQQAVEAIERVRADAAPARMPPLADGYEPAVFTAGAAFDLPEGARVTSLGGAVPNAGITAFEIRTRPGRPLEDVAFLSIANFDPTPRELRLSIGPPGRPRASRTLTLAPGASIGELLPMRDLDPGIVEVRIESAGDRFAPDDVAYGWLPDRRVVSVALVSDGNPALAAVLAADPRVALTIVSPGAYGPGTSADILVFDRFTPDIAPSRPALIFGPSSTVWLPLAPESRTLPAIQLAAGAHPLTRDVDLDDVHVTRSAEIAADGAVVLAADQGRAVIAAGRAAAPWVAVGFSLEDTSFASEPSFPMFVANVLAWFRGDVPPISGRFGQVELPMQVVSLTAPDGRDVPVHGVAGTTSFFADAPGVYMATTAAGRVPLVINTGEAGPFESPAGMAEADIAGSVSRPWWTVLAMFALLLLAAEWWTWQRRITM